MDYGLLICTPAYLHIYTFVFYFFSTFNLYNSLK